MQVSEVAEVMLNACVWSDCPLAIHSNYTGLPIEEACKGLNLTFEAFNVACGPFVGTSDIVMFNKELIALPENESFKTALISMLPAGWAIGV